MLVDKNPFPFVGEFELTPDSGKADLAMRIRVNTYSFIRAIAELNDGRLVMTKKFVKASGGCSAPIGADLDASMKRLGKMKFRLDDGAKTAEPNLVQLLISHPNLTRDADGSDDALCQEIAFHRTIESHLQRQAGVDRENRYRDQFRPEFPLLFCPAIGRGT